MILKDAGQDRTCAKSNVASRHLYHATLAVLWSHVTITLPPVRRTKSLWRPKQNIGWLTRFIVTDGAQHIRFVQFLASNPCRSLGGAVLLTLNLYPAFQLLIPKIQ
jgi:hypothetical protein